MGKNRVDSHTEEARSNEGRRGDLETTDSPENTVDNFNASGSETILQ